MGVGRNDTGRSIPEANWEGHHIKKSMIIASDYIDAIITEINPVDDIFNDFKQKGITIL